MSHYRRATALLLAAATSVSLGVATPLASAVPPAPVTPGSNAATAAVKDGFLTSQDGKSTPIYWKSQTIPNAKGTVVVVHGASEHLGRYDYVSNRLLDAGYNVNRMDHRGHGKTGQVPGTPVPAAHIDDFRSLVDDVNLVTQKAKTENPGLKTFMLGHSMGAIAAQYYGIVYPGQVDGIIANGGGAPMNLAGKKDRGEIITPDEITDAQRKLNPTISELLPLTDLTSFNAHAAQQLIPGRTDLRIPSFPGSEKIFIPNILSTGVASDKAISEDYKNDPLVNKGLTLGMVEQVAIGGIFDGLNADKFTAPTLITYGTKDGLVPSYFSVDWYNAISSQDKQLIGWEGQMHEVFNEPAKGQAMDTVIDWINKHNGA